jgi:hypothetical protein
MNFNSVQHRIDTIHSLTELWTALLPKAPVPSNAQFNRWIGMHTSMVLLFAIETAADKYARTEPPMTGEHLIRYCSSVANNRRYKTQEATQ